MNNEAVGLDIGTDTIKLVQLKKDKKGVWLVKAVVAELDKYPALPDESEGSRVVRVLKEILKTHNIKAKKVIPVIPRLSALINNVKLPPVHPSRLEQLIEYEARQQSPFTDEEPVVAYHCFKNGNVQGERDVLLVIAKNEPVEHAFKTIKRLKLEIETMDVHPFALYNLCRFSEIANSEETVCFIEIGASSTDIVIFGGKSPLFTRCISIDGEHITDRPVLDQLIDDVHKTMLYYRSKGRQNEIDRFVLSGRHLQNIDTYLGERFGKQVELFNPFKRINTNGYTPNNEMTGSFSIATGLALRGLGKGEININLVPIQVKTRKERIHSLKYLIPAYLMAFLLPLLFVPGIRQGLRDRELKLGQINLMLSRHESFLSQLPEIQKIREGNGSLEMTLAQLQGLTYSSFIKLEALYELGRITPANTTLTKLSIDTQNKLVIEGTSESYKEIKEFISNLENSSYFKEIKLIGAGSYKPVSPSHPEIAGRGRMRGAPAPAPEPAPKPENVPAASQDKITFTIEMALK